MMDIPNIIQRKAPDFGFDDSLPKYWFAGDPFKTRFFDAMSTMFPEGEKYFIRSVRAYREQITDPDMKQAVSDFIYQEAQHSIAHGLFNDRLKAQGINVDKFEQAMRGYLNFVSKYLPASVNLANTAAAEHMTAIISHIWTRDDIQRDSDPRMRALLYWHGVEEIEHKAVAFDVLQQVAKAGYLTRILTMAYETVSFPLSVHLFMDEMLRVDGFSGWERTRMWANGLRWLYGPQGLMHSLLPSYLSYYRPDFHPWQEGQMETYHQWRQAYESTGNAIAAADMGKSLPH
ncbi:metal-dependent hydrolase [Moraxellaceae bacterium AER2_44_116]|nr:metal-dependent hydrolase [Moraxellaceae bacterium AER2_44_116]